MFVDSVFCTHPEMSYGAYSSADTAITYKCTTVDFINVIYLNFRKFTSGMMYASHRHDRVGNVGTPTELFQYFWVTFGRCPHNVGRNAFWVHSLQAYAIHVESPRFVEHMEHLVLYMFPWFRVKPVVIHRVTECVQLHHAHTTIESCYIDVW